MVNQDAADKGRSQAIQACRAGDTERSGAAVASVVKLMGLVRLELARPLSCSTIRSRTLSLIASIYTASIVHSYNLQGDGRLSRGSKHLEHVELQTKISQSLESSWLKTLVSTSQFHVH